MDTYHPRTLACYDVVEMSGIRTKPYTIFAEGREGIDMAPVLDHAEIALAASSIPSTARHGLGYLIYHAGMQTNWLLTRVWMPGGIVSGLLARIENGERVDVTEPIIECVWEEVVVHHERMAWVRHMMGRAEDPDAYLDDRLPSGSY